MYSFQYDFYPDLKKLSFDEYSQEFWSFVSSLNKNGQIIADRLLNIAEHVDRLYFHCITPDEDSLESKYYNKYCYEYHDKLEELSIRPPKYNLLGRTLDTYDICKCENSSFYILITTLLHTGSPVRCGDCGNFIPLYKLPKLDGEEEYNSILGWEK